MLLRVSLILCLIAVPFIAHAQVENLALNPSFEEDEVIYDDPDWYSWGTWGDADGLNSTIEIDANEFIDGSRSLKINPQGVENWQFIVLNLPILVEVGETYTASIWVKAAEERPFALNLKASDNSTDICYSDLGTITTEWTEYAFSCETPVDDMKLELFCAASDVSFWVDFLNVYKGPYVEGIMPSEMVSPVEPAGKLAVKWGALKSLK